MNEAQKQIFRMSGREPPKARKIDVATIQILDEPLPPKRHASPIIPKGQGPWQRLAERMNVGQSVKLPHNKADSFRRACSLLGIKTETRKLDDADSQIQITAKAAT
jgi:hypothetical protein